MFMELLGAGTSLLGSIGAYKKEKAAVKAYNKQIDSQLQQMERGKTRIGIDNRQAQDWATMQIAKAGSNFNAANAVSNMYNGRVASNGERYNQLESRRIELADKKISKPKFSDHLLSSIPSIAGSALAMADMFPEAEKKANGFVDRISDYVRRTREEERLVKNAINDSADNIEILLQNPDDIPEVINHNQPIRPTFLKKESIEERLVKNAINDSAASLLKKPDNMPEVINRNLPIRPTFLEKESIIPYDPVRAPFYYPIYIDTPYNRYTR